MCGLTTHGPRYRSALVGLDENGKRPRIRGLSMSIAPPDPERWELDPDAFDR